MVPRMVPRLGVEYVNYSCSENVFLFKLLLKNMIVVKKHKKCEKNVKTIKTVKTYVFLLLKERLFHRKTLQLSVFVKSAMCYVTIMVF